MRAISGSTLHAVVWGGTFYYVAMNWEKPYIAWAQKNGFGLPIILNQVLKCWDIVFAHPYMSLTLFGLLVAADFCVMVQLAHTPTKRLLRDIWFVTVLSVPLLAIPWLGILQTKVFLEKQIDPYSMQLGSPEIVTDVVALNGCWIADDSSENVLSTVNQIDAYDRIELKDGTFRWESHEKGIADGMVYLEPLRTPKHIQFVAMHPDSRWTIRTGIYRLDGQKLVMMLPKWDYLSLPPPLDFEWDDPRYQTIVMIKEAGK